MAFSILKYKKEFWAVYKFIEKILLFPIKLLLLIPISIGMYSHEKTNRKAELGQQYSKSLHDSLNGIKAKAQSKPTAKKPTPIIKTVAKKIEMSV